MLTADLLRVRDDGDSIEPRYIKIEGKAGPRYQARAEQMIALFSSHIGQRRAVLDEAIGDLIGDGTDFNLSRGFKKLLEDRSTFEVGSVASPIDVREVVFGLSATHHPIVASTDTLHTHTREDILDMAAVELQRRLEEAKGEPLAAPVTRADVEEALYGDLNENQRLTSFKELEGIELLHRYNLALAQAVLYRARELRISLQAGAQASQYRQLFNYLKFYQLMHRVRRSPAGAWKLTLDGPISLLKSTNKYGLKMAMFLPALLLCEGWAMEADLVWGPSREARTFILDDGCGLKSHYKAKGAYVTEEQAHFEKRWKAMKTPWKISRGAELLDLGGHDVLVPDVVFTHKEDGRKAMMEIVGYWRRGWLKTKAQNVQRHGPKNLMLAVSDRLQTDRDKPQWDELPVALMPFKGVILPKKVLAIVEEIAT